MSWLDAFEQRITLFFILVHFVTSFWLLKLSGILQLPIGWRPECLLSWLHWYDADYNKEEEPKSPEQDANWQAISAGHADP